MALIHNADRTDTELLTEFVFDQYARRELQARMDEAHSTIEGLEQALEIQGRELAGAHCEAKELKRHRRALGIAAAVIFGLLVYGGGSNAL